MAQTASAAGKPRTLIRARHALDVPWESTKHAFVSWALAQQRVCGDFGAKKMPRGRKLDADELRALFEALDLNAILDGTAKPQKLSQTVRLGIALLFYAPVRSHSLVAAEWLEAIAELPLDAAPVAAVASKATERARKALDAWQRWQSKHTPGPV